MNGPFARIGVAASLAAALCVAACSSTPDAGSAQAPASVQVSGEVRTPGRVALPTGPNPLALVDALGACGGFTENADPSRIRVTRNSSTGRIQALVNYADIVEGRRADFRLRPDDQIVVPRRGR